MVGEQDSRYWILGYHRGVDYESERKRKTNERQKEYNTLYKCETCGKVWERFISYRKKQIVTYTDMPSYGLNRKQCKLCKGECNG